MRPLRLGARWASSALAVLLLASSLTCLTAACATLCGPPAGTVTLSEGNAPNAAHAAESALPPCHRPADSTAPAPDGGGCDAGSPCCARWLDDHATLQVTDPAPLRTLLPAGAHLAVVPPVPVASAFATDPPDLGPPSSLDDAPPSAAPRAASGTRGPPHAACAA